MIEKITLSLIKADIGSMTGHNKVHPELIEIAKRELEKSKKEGRIIDYFVFSCGDDLELLFSHRKFIEDPEIHGMAWEIFKKCTEKAKELKLYGAGQDLLKETFSGNLKGMGPGFAEMCFTERPSEPIVIFAADKTSPGAWNLPLYKIFADPFNTPGLLLSEKMSEGFVFEVHDIIEDKKIRLKCPEEAYELLALIGSTARYLIKSVFSKDGEIAAVTSTTRLSLIAGRYVGKDDPCMIVRAQHDFPSVGEIIEPFAYPHLVEGWMRGSHNAPLMPVSLEEAMPTRFDGPPRVIALGFVLKDGNFIGPVDLFKDPAFDLARQKANEIADYIRKMGPFEPHRLPETAMEYTGLQKLQEKLKKRFEEL